MSINISLSEQQAQALAICMQLLDAGEFKLSGKDLEVAVQAKRLLAEVAQQAANAGADSETPQE